MQELEEMKTQGREKRPCVNNSEMFNGLEINRMAGVVLEKKIKRMNGDGKEEVRNACKTEI